MFYVGSGPDKSYARVHGEDHYQSFEDAKEAMRDLAMPMQIVTDVCGHEWPLHVMKMGYDEPCMTMWLTPDPEDA